MSGEQLYLNTFNNYILYFSNYKYKKKHALLTQFDTSRNMHTFLKVVAPTYGIKGLLWLTLPLINESRAAH